MAFKAFDPHEEVETYRAHLPHWRQQCVTYFITMRLADSLPQSKLSEWEHDRQCWLRANGCKNHEDFQLLPEKVRHEFHRRFTKQFHAWLDAGHGACWLRRPNASQIVAEAMQHFDGVRYMLERVVMPNHLHALISPVPEHKLTNILHSLKSFTAKRINRLLDVQSQRVMVLGTKMCHHQKTYGTNTTQLRPNDGGGASGDPT